MSDTARQPAGVPAGGQFAATTRNEPAIELGGLVDVIDPVKLGAGQVRARYTEIRDTLVAAGVTGKLEVRPYSATSDFMHVALTTDHDNETYQIGYGQSVTVASMSVEARTSAYPIYGPPANRPILMLNQLREAQRGVATARVWDELTAASAGDIQYTSLRVMDNGTGGTEATVTATIDGHDYEMLASTSDEPGPEHVYVNWGGTTLPPILAKPVLERVGRDLGGHLFPENHAAVILRSLAISAPKHKTWPPSS